MEPKKNEAKVRALRLLTIRDRSVYELKERLKQHFSEEEASETVAYLKELGYLDDLRFATNYVQYRNRMRPTGNFLLRIELRQKGIDDSFIEQVLNPPDQQYELAQVLAKQRLGSLERFEDIVRRRRLYGLLERRGFPSSVIKSVVSDLLDSDLENEYN